MARSTNRLIQFVGTSKNVRSVQCWYPAADVYQTPNGWIVKVELAGVSPDEVTIEISGNTLHIAGTRRDTSCTEGVNFQQMEITYSNFEKTLRFPATIEDAVVEHRVDNGLLIIDLKKNSDKKRAKD